MRKTSFAAILSLVVLVAAPAIALAQGLSERDLYGQKTHLTKFPVGACVNNEGGLWQQLSDGTWAPPNDNLNTCRNEGLPTDWTSNPYLNPWMQSGIDYNNPYTQPYQRLPQSPWGTNYPGGFRDYNDWFLHCVVMQSVFPRPECQMFPTYRNTSYIDINLGKIDTGKIDWKKVLIAAGLGWGLSKLL